jgi:MFS family permease
MPPEGRSFTFLIIALWLGNILPALDATLVGTALPTVIGSLDGARLYSWVFAAYLLALTVSIPVFGKLTDMLGRKPVYFFGMALFIGGSALSSLAQNIEQLIACRVLLGLATASVVPAAMTIMGDAIPMERRAKIQWVFASAWLVASVVGPFIASTVIQYLHWRLVFLVLVPPGLLATYLMATRYHEHVEHRSREVDVVGGALLGGGVLALLFALSPTNRSGGINFASSGGLLLVALLLLVVFVRHELRAPMAILPPRLFLVPVLGIAALGSIASGAVQSGAQSFIPMFVQGGQGGTAADVGLVLPWLTIGCAWGSAAASSLACCWL